jgi:hypothetical protein
LEQSIVFEAFDDVPFKKDQELGKTKPQKISDFIAKPKKMEVEIENAGKLTFSVSFAKDKKLAQIEETKEIKKPEEVKKPEITMEQKASQEKQNLELQKKKAKDELAKKVANDQKIELDEMMETHKVQLKIY